MTMLPLPQRPTAHNRPAGLASVVRLLLAALLGLAAALLISCSSSGKGLIPASAAGPLKSDFEEVQTAAESANGDCTATEAALLKTAQDFAALPLAVDAGLRNNLRQGIANLRVRAHEMCSQPSAQTTTTGPATTTTMTSTTPSTPTTTTPSTATTTSPTSTVGGGTPAPGEEETAEPSEGKGKGNGNGHGNGNGNGNGNGHGHGHGHGGAGAEEGAAGGVGAGGQEAGK